MATKMHKNTRFKLGRRMDGKKQVLRSFGKFEEKQLKVQLEQFGHN